MSIGLRYAPPGGADRSEAYGKLEYKLGEIIQEPDTGLAVQPGERRFRFRLTSISFVRMDGSVLTTTTP